MRLAPTFILVFLSVLPARAQDAHADRLAGLAATCLVEVVSPLDAFRFQPQGVLAGASGTDLISSPLAATWTRAGHRVHRNPDGAELPLLVLTMDRAAVSYRRSGRRNVVRESALALTWWLSGADGAVQGTDACHLSEEDILTRDAARSLADRRSTITDPALPPRSRLRQAIEPAVLLGATAVGTYLLFHLRSRRADNG
ncbi:MAG: hypothetical protein O2899_03380 [Bacteroidetes bacterium]|nr:hypothetical protein [Bacteroidota bacterium]